MELRHLRHFVAVVQAGNLSRAAETAFISQPALTRSIKNLEELVGAVLLERLPRGIVPTPAGQTLYDYAVFILNEVRRARDEVAATDAGERGVVAIGSAAMFSTFMVDKAVAELALAFPEVALTVSVGFFEELVDQLVEGRLDVLFSNIPGGALPDELVVEQLYSTRTVLVVRGDHPFAKRTNIPRAELARARWVIVNQLHMRDYLTQFFAAEGLAMSKAVIQTNSLEMITGLLQRGDFVGLMPDHLVRQAIRKGQLKRLTAEAPVTRRAGLIYRKDGPLRPAVAHFMGVIRRHCAIESGLEEMKTSHAPNA
jgi:DNA-binding transcriptional LysR family regulator